MKKIAVLLSSVALAAAFVIAPATYSATVNNTVIIETKQQAVQDPTCVRYADQIVKLVNNERRSRGLRELKIYPLLTKAALIRANELPQKWDHTRPDGRRCFSVLTDLDINSTYNGENIAMGYSNPSMTFNGWMTSEGHRDNILNASFRYIGVGCANINGVYYWVQEFIDTNEDLSSYTYLPEDHGEMNGDGFVDAVDASMVLAEYAAVSAGKAHKLGQAQIARADMNGDTIVDAVDASIVLAIYAANSSR